MKLKVIVIITTFFLLVPSPGSSIEIPRLQGYVNDYGNMISPAVEAELTAVLKSFEASDSTQIVILTIPSLKGETIEDYNIKVAEAWKIGQTGKDNGIILTVSKEDRKMRIEVGRGLEGKLTDLTSGRIIDQVMRPKFREGNFDAGFTAAVVALIEATRGEFKAEEKPSVRARSSFRIHPSFIFVFIPWIILLVLISVLRNTRTKGFRRGRPLTYSSGSGWDSGNGGTSSDSGGGGFDSGGGGDFGGGGASGDW